MFLADDTQLGRKVAIKFLTEALEHDAKARERLQREARSAAALDHPYICNIYEITEIDGRTGIVMEHVSGETLQATLRRSRPSATRSFEIAGEIAEALEEAHKRRVIHRDLKPSNVMVTDQGHVKVMDFGLAKVMHSDSQALEQAETIQPITESGTRVGTPGYMAPEQLLGGEADARSDIFAFGILLYELLAGVHPFTRSSQSETMSAIIREAAVPIRQYAGDLPKSARLMLDRLLAKEPHRRYQSFEDLRVDLSQLAQETSGQTPVPRSVETVEPSGPTRTPYVGRETERAELRRLLEQAKVGRGSLVLIGGEPGVGKTRLTEELVAEARACGFLTLTGHCYEAAGTPPYIPFVEILERVAKVAPRTAFREALGDAAQEVARVMPELRRLFPDLPPPTELPPDQQRRFLFNAYGEFVERASRVMPILTIYEDLHWADEPTVQLFRHQAQRVGSEPSLMVGTYRDVELDVTRPFAKVLELLLRERQATRIALRRLPEADVETMLEGLGGPSVPAGLAQVVFRETEGNPFFVEEVFQHLSEEGRLFDDAGRWKADLRIDQLRVPEGVRLVIGRRLERVSDDARKALTTGAVIGRHFDLRLLEAAGKVDEDDLLDALEAAEQAQLISSTTSGRDVRYTFVHELIRQTLVENLSLPRRQRLHLRIANALETLHSAAPEKAASILAHHFYQAGAAADDETTLRYLVMAGDQALASAAFEEAVEHLERALSFEEGLEPRQRADLLARRGRAFRSLGRPDETLRDWSAAADAYAELGAGEQLARVCRDAAFVLSYQGRATEAFELCERGLAAAGELAPTEQARLSTAAGFYRGISGDYSGGRDLIDRATRVAEPLGDRQLLGEVLASSARLGFYYSDFADQLKAGRRAIKELEAAGDAWQPAYTSGLMQLGLMFLGRPREIRRTDAACRLVAQRLGHHQALFPMDLASGVAELLLTGQIAECERFFSRGMERWRGAGALSWFAHLYLGCAAFWQGRWDAARDSIDRALQSDPWPYLAGVVWGSLLVQKAYAGDADTLRFWADKRTTLPATSEPMLLGQTCLVLGATEALAVVGDREQAHALYPWTLETMKGGMVLPMGLMMSFNETSAGIAAACGAEWETAERHHQTAIRQAEEMPHKIEQPHTRRWYARMLIDRNGSGDKDKARVLLDEAIEMYGTLGIPKHLEMAKEMRSGL